MRLEEQKKKEAEELLAKSKANEKSEVVVEQTENHYEGIIIFKDGVAEVPKEVAEVMNTFNKVNKDIIHEVEFEETLSQDNEVWLELLQEFNNQLNSKSITIGDFILKMKTKFELKRI